MCADIVIVGAGPVGLWEAIQIKKRNPALAVTMYERHADYQRSHVLRLQQESVLLYSKHSKDPLEQAFYQEVMGKSLVSMFGAAAGKAVFVGTNVLENALKRYAQALGVEIALHKIDSPDEAESLHPECRDFVAADGAKSKMREALLGPDGVHNYDLQHVVELKYEANAEAARLSFAEQYKTNKLMDFMAFEYVGRGKKQDVAGARARVTVRFFIDKETYDALPQASFKDPLTLNDSRIPPRLAQDIRTYLSVREAKAQEELDEASVKMSKLTLSQYVAKKFAVRRDSGRNWYLAGDAALGVPYFRALNSGMIIASQLAGILTSGLSSQQKVLAYNAWRPLDVAWEFTEARVKDAGLKLYDLFRKASAKVPWQMVKWSRGDEAEFKGKPRGPTK